MSKKTAPTITADHIAALVLLSTHHYFSDALTQEWALPDGKVHTMGCMMDLEEIGLTHNTNPHGAAVWKLTDAGESVVAKSLGLAAPWQGESL